MRELHYKILRTFLCDRPIHLPADFWRQWCVIVCDLETLGLRRPWPELGCWDGAGVLRILAIHVKFIIIKKHSIPLKRRCSKLNSFFSFSSYLTENGVDKTPQTPWRRTSRGSGAPKHTECKNLLLVLSDSTSHVFFEVQTYISG